MVHQKTVSTILNKKRRRDPWFLDDYTLNPYSGYSFNCLFCYIRGSTYGINMARSLAVKKNAVEILDRQLANRAKKSQYGIIAMSSATDPYLQADQETELSRHLLKIILKHRFPVHIITRSDGVLRDLDVLEEIGDRAILPAELKEKLPSGTIITFSFSSLDIFLKPPYFSFENLSFFLKSTLLIN
ncbi:MAG: SPL family radical SAM protein [Owenweeksia sp.]